MIFLIDQIKTFFCMLLFGVSVGLIFNIYQVFLHHVKPKRIIIHIIDVIISLILGVTGFLLLLNINYGNLRSYVILAIIFGFIIYYSLSNYICKIRKK
ncbi:MAG: spore cortex biosynthesis protein YabQ [Halanaerobiales bacterium]